MIKKINWGVAIVLSFIVFGIFIGTLVYLIQTDQRYAHTLVVEEYFKQEQRLATQLKAIQNGKQWSSCLETEEKGDYLLLKGCAFETIKVPIYINGYRPNDKSKDFKISTSVIDGSIPIEKKYLRRGNWILTLEWEQTKKLYRVERKIVY